LRFVYPLHSQFYVLLHFRDSIIRVLAHRFRNSPGEQGIQAVHYVTVDAMGEVLVDVMWKLVHSILEFSAEVASAPKLPQHL
jgi:hypothetical protein